jgi:hypothetical protein
MSTLSSLGRLRLRALALLAAMFLVGMCAGVGASRLLWFRRPPHTSPPVGPYGQLYLSAEQQESVRAILDKHKADIDAIMGEAMPKVRAVQDVIDREVGNVLTDEQRGKLDQMKADVLAHPLHEMPGMGHPPPWLPGMPPPVPPPGRAP